jgi:cytochrome oxidase assembly protein ShyY1
MSKDLKTLPVFIDLDLQYTPEMGPVGGQTRLEFTNHHLLYTAHWWILCAIFTFIIVKGFRKV